jgi:IS4 transposase
MNYSQKLFAEQVAIRLENTIDSFFFAISSRIYGKRWDIEVCFKMLKQHLRLEKEAQLRDYDGLVGHATVVMKKFQ